VGTAEPGHELEDLKWLTAKVEQLSLSGWNALGFDHYIHLNKSVAIIY